MPRNRPESRWIFLVIILGGAAFSLGSIWGWLVGLMRDWILLWL